jgi:hypothetical protein
MRSKRLLLLTIIGLIIFNSLFLVSAINILTQSFSFISGRFVFQYDDTKLTIERVGDFVYNSEGKLQQLTVYVKNKDPSNPYSGYMEVIVDSQQYTVDVNIQGGKTKGYDIELESPLTITGPLVINVNVIISGVGVADLVAQKGTAIADTAIDGTIGTEWDDAQNYEGVSITPSGTATIWVKNDGTNLYVAVQFTADSDDPWVAFQLGATGCMDSGADGALFGHSDHADDGYVDIKFTGAGPIDVDATQDGVGAINVDSGNLVTVELKKPLDSGDSAGGDITWTVGGTFNLVIAWDTDGGGSSRGAISHRSATPLGRTILIGA